MPTVMTAGWVPPPAPEDNPLSRRAGRRLSEAERRRVRELSEAGWSQRSIAAELGCSRSAVRYALDSRRSGARAGPDGDAVAGAGGGAQRAGWGWLLPVGMLAGLAWRSVRGR